MPRLEWIGKEKVINHHYDVPFRVLEHKYGFENKKEVEKEVLSGNKIIKGDNLEALKALLPEYEGKIKCIYIDPPYNTGNENWVYNDNVNDPKIKKWLGEVVGKEGEDLSRHDKWLCMMYPRLKLLHKLLADDGAIFISIDDNEQANLKLICDEIFGVSNFISSNIRECVKGGTRSKSLIASNHDYIVIYSKNKNELSLNGREIDGVELKLQDEKGFYNKGRELNKWGAGSAREDSPSMWFPILSPENQEVYPIRNDGSEGRWRWGKKKLIKAVMENDVIFEKRENGTYIVYEKIRNDSKREIAHSSLLNDSKYSNASGSEIIKSIFQQNKSCFSYPKPVFLIEHFISLSTDQDSIILDSFAGSGTTAHAVLNINKEDGGNRKFILIEMEDYAENMTAERVKRVIKGYGDEKNFVEGIEASFDFYELGEPLFLENNLNPNIEEEKIRKYIYYTETNNILEKIAHDDNKYYLNTLNNTSYYFYYEKEKQTDLDYPFLSTITTKSEQYIIFADNCLLTDDFMKKSNIIFKKIPRDISRI